MMENRARILVVDDYIDSADSMAILLRMWGYDVEVAYGGAATLKAVQAQQPQVMLVDLIMPGMDGFRLVELLRQLPMGFDAAVVAITGHSDKAGFTRSRDLGFAGHFLKPVDPDVLQALLLLLVEPARHSRRVKSERTIFDWLPHVPDVAQLTSDSHSGLGYATRQPCVLVVDDNIDVRGFLNAYLRQEGFTVRLAESGPEGLALYQSQSDEIDVVLLDVCMPGMDGLETMRALRAWDPKVRCCILSGGFDPYTESDLRQGGATAVLSNPSEIDQVASVVCRLTRERRRSLATNW